MSELLKCPFCGGKDITYFFDITSGFVCEDCGVALDGFKTYEEAIKAWNTRKPMDRIVERLEEKLFWTEASFDEDGYCNDDSEEAVLLLDAIEIIKEEGGLWQK